METKDWDEIPEGFFLLRLIEGGVASLHLAVKTTMDLPFYGQPLLPADISYPFNKIPRSEHLEFWEWVGANLPVFLFEIL